MGCCFGQSFRVAKGHRRCNAVSTPSSLVGLQGYIVTVLSLHLSIPHTLVTFLLYSSVGVFRQGQGNGAVQGILGSEAVRSLASALPYPSQSPTSLSEFCNGGPQF